MHSRNSGLPPDTRNTVGTLGNVFGSVPAREGPSSDLFENARNLASSSCGLGSGAAGNTSEHGRVARQEPHSSSIPTTRFNQGIANLNSLSHTGGTYSRNGMSYPRFPIPGLRLGKFPDSLEFQSWKVNFKTDVCAKSAFPYLTMHWIKEVETAKSMDHLMTSRSITGRKDHPDYDMLDAMIASALKKLLTHVHFRKRESVHQQRAQKDDRFPRGRQIAYMIYEHLRATGAYEAVQGLSDLFNVRLQNDDVQDFDTRWDQALLATSEKLTEMVLEGFIQVKIAGFCSASGCIGFV